MKENVSRVFDLLQKLQLQPTETNVTILAECMMRLREVYAEIPDEKEQKPTETKEKEKGKG